MRATLTILGMYEWDNTLFDGMSLPNNVSRETMINNILLETAELECIYPSAPFFKTALNMWSAMEVEKWTKLEATQNYEYNPIENYNRIEEWSDTATATGTGTAKGKNTGLTENRMEVWGYNSATSVPQNIATGNNTDNVENTNTASSEQSGTRKGNIHGNIGITTTQHMIKEEREILDWDIHHYIIDEFKRRFCVLVY